MDTNQPHEKVPVVLHFRDGRTSRYSSEPRIERAREAIQVADGEGKEDEILFSALKAVFFLRPDSGETAPPTGDRAVSLLVEFQDGERIRGVSDEYQADRNGFFLYPVDRSKNDRIFVVNSAIVSVEVDRL